MSCVSGKESLETLWVLPEDWEFQDLDVPKEEENREEEENGELKVSVQVEMDDEPEGEVVLEEGHAERKAYYRLKASDLNYFRVPNVPMVYLFEQEMLVPEIVKKGLEMTLDTFPIVAGRVVKRGSRFYVKCPKSKGVEFQNAVSYRPVPESNGLGTASWEPFLVNRTPVDKVVKHEVHVSQEPLMRARLTNFPNANASVLSLSFVHCIMDGSAIAHFLNTWSHNCGILADLEKDKIFPQERPAKPVLERDVVKVPGSKLKQVKQEAKRRSKRSQYAKMTVREGLKVASAQIGANFTDTVADFSLNLNDVKTAKDECMKTLEDGQWVSSYEVMQAMLLRALSFVDGDPKGRDMKARVLVNTRGRSTLVPNETFFGNALAFIPVDIPPSAVRGENWLGKVAYQMHEQLRTNMKKTELLEEMDILYEHGLLHESSSKDMFSRIRWHRPWGLTFLKGHPVCNSWIGYNWLELNFGGPTHPSKFRVPKTFTYRRHLFIAPYTKEKVLVRMQLPHAEMKRFHRAIEALDLPLKIMQ